MCRFWNLPSNDVFAKIARNEFYLLFQGKIYLFFISETIRAIAKMCVWDICSFWYLPSKDVIAKIALRDFDLLFESPNFI